MLVSRLEMGLGVLCDAAVNGVVYSRLRDIDQQEPAYTPHSHAPEYRHASSSTTTAAVSLIDSKNDMVRFLSRNGRVT
jgi:hypothetical protein